MTTNTRRFPIDSYASPLIVTLFTPENKYFYQTMRYYHISDGLYIRGTFRAASTGINGGIIDVSTILNHTVPKDFSHEKLQ